MGFGRGVVVVIGCAFLAIGCVAVIARLVLGGEPVRDLLRQRVIERLKEKVAEQAQKQGPGPDYQLIDKDVGSYQESPYGPGDYRRNVAFGKGRRYYLVHVPRGYDKGTATAVVLNFHGGGGNPVQQRNDSGMDPVSDANGFIVVYPAGTGQLSEDRFLFWNAGVGDNYATKLGVDDIGFVKAMLDDLERLFHVEPKKIYATGFSNGAFFSYRLACELSSQIAAVAPVSGTLGADLKRFVKAPSRPVSIIHFHGKQDTFCPYAGGPGKGGLESVALPGAEKTIQFWVAFDGCQPKPVEELRKGRAVCRRYGGGKDKSEVVLWTLEDGGHTWPGGESTLPVGIAGPINHDISATELMWKFFQDHPIP